MHFWTNAECKEWLTAKGRVLPDQQPGLWIYEHAFHRERSLEIVSTAFIAEKMSDGDGVLLWMSQWGIWQENKHLYYRLRQSYGDHRQLWQAPGHYFHEYEMRDLATFLQVATLNGWGGYLLAEKGHLSAFLSHQDYIAFYAEQDRNLEELRRAFSGRPQASAPAGLQDPGQHRMPM